MLPSAAIAQARILIVDDPEAPLHALERMLHDAGFAALTLVPDPHQVVARYPAVRPDLIILPLLGPPRDGLAVLAQVAMLISPGSYVPILVVTTDATAETRRRALAAGAADFLTPPLDPSEVTLRAQPDPHPSGEAPRASARMWSRSKPTSTAGSIRG